MLKIRNQNGDWQDVECYVKDGTFKKCDPFYFDGEKWVGVGPPAVDYSEGAYLSIFDDPSTSLMAHFISTKATATCQIKTGAGAWQNVSMLKAVPFTGTDKNVLWFELDALTPATEYEMRLQGEERTYYFTTIDPDEDIKVAVISDQGLDYTAFAADLPLGFDLMHTQSTDIIAIAGDAVHDDNKRIEAWTIFWEGYFRGTKDRLIPMVVTLGNHDGQPILEGGGFANLWYGSGGRPHHAVYAKTFFANQEDDYCFIDVGSDFTMLLLNSGHTTPITGAQTTFLQNTLSLDVYSDPVAEIEELESIIASPSVAGDGRNLFKWKTAQLVNSSGVVQTSSVGHFTNGVYTLTRSQYQLSIWMNIPDSGNFVRAGVPLTVSFDVIVPTAQNIRLSVRNTSGGTTTASQAITANTVTHMALTVTPPAGLSYQQQIRLQGDTSVNPNNTSYIFTNVKVELGGTATPWSEVPEYALEALIAIGVKRMGKNVLPIFHVSPVPGWYENSGYHTQVIDNWAPIFKDTGVKFVANGHEHVNLVTKPVNRVSAGVMGPVTGGVVYVQGMSMGCVTRGINNYYANCVEFIENTHKAIYFLNYKKSGTAKLDMIALDGTVLYTLER